MLPASDRGKCLTDLFDVGSLEEEDHLLVTLGAMHPFPIAMDLPTMIIEEDIQVRY